MLRSLAAIFAGFIAWTVLWLVSNATLAVVFADRFAADGTTFDPTVLGLVLASSALFSLLAGWLTARTAAANPAGHALVLGVVLLAVGVLVQLQYWQVMPLWYHLCFLALLLPLTALGGRLRSARALPA